MRPRLFTGRAGGLITGAASVASRQYLIGIILAALALASFEPAVAAVAQKTELQPQGLFERNLGQYAPQVMYRGRFPQLDAAIHEDASVSIYPRRKGATDVPVVRIRPVGDMGERSAVASQPSAYRTNYFGKTAAPIVDVPHFARVTFRSAYPGIDLAYHSERDKLEFDFIVRPGADPSAIRLRIEGASQLRLEKNGDLAIDSGGAVVYHRSPVSYQVKNGKRVSVGSHYVLQGADSVAIKVAAYDRSRELVIDPVVEYASYMGGTSHDFATGVRIGPAGFVYITGSTTSSGFPTANALDSSLTGGGDAFVAKINPVTGKAVYSTFLGGGDGDSATALAVDSEGAVYVTGTGGSRFPTTTGAYRTSGTGSLGFVTKIHKLGNALTYSTFLPGTRPAAIDIDSAFQAVVTGSAGTAFTASSGAHQAASGGNGGFLDPTVNGDAFLVKLNAMGSGVAFATFYGGSGTDYGAGVAFDSAGRIAVAGSTMSTNLAMTTPIQSTLGGTEDGFLAVFSATGSLVASTYFGGTGQDNFTGIAADPFGNVVASGKTRSNDLPTLNARLTRVMLGQPAQEASKGFLAKFSVAPLQTKFATYTGASIYCCDTAFGVAVDAAGDIYVSGKVVVDQFPTFQSVNAFLTHAYVLTKLNTSNTEEAVFVAGYSRDGQALRFQSMVAPCKQAEFCDRAPIGARDAGQVVVGGVTDYDWMPISAPTTQASRGAGLFMTDAWVLTMITESPTLQLGIPASALAAGTVTLTATSYGAGTNGSVTFKDGTTTIGTVAMVEGVAKLDTSFVPGVRRLTATLNSSTSPLRLLPVSPVLGSCP